MATVVRMIHVPKTGGTSALNFLSELNAGGRKNGAHFERYNIKGSPHVVVNKTKVRRGGSMARKFAFDAPSIISLAACR